MQQVRVHRPICQGQQQHQTPLLLYYREYSADLPHAQVRYLLQAHCAEHSWSSDSVLDNTQQYIEEAEGRDVAIMMKVPQPWSANVWYQKLTLKYGRSC